MPYFKNPSKSLLSQKKLCTHIRSIILSVLSVYYSTIYLVAQCTARAKGQGQNSRRRLPTPQHSRTALQRKSWEDDIQGFPQRNPQQSPFRHGFSLPRPLLLSPSSPADPSQKSDPDLRRRRKGRATIATWVSGRSCHSKVRGGDSVWGIWHPAQRRSGPTTNEEQQKEQQEQQQGGSERKGGCEQKRRRSALEGDLCFLGAVDEQGRGVLCRDVI